MNRIIEKRIVPIAVIEDAADAVGLAQALRAGGLNIIEIPLRTEAALDAIGRIRQECPEMLVGAGTIVKEEQVDRALESGAQFGVAPGLNESVVNHARNAALPFIPGVMTPSEIERAMGLDCALLKFFPAEAAGGIRALDALAGPYAGTGVHFIALGGINPSNAAAYLANPLVAAVGGSWLTHATAIKTQDWAGVTRRAVEALALAGSPAS